MSPSRPPVRVGIVGCGNVLPAYMTLLDGLQRQGLAEVVGYCGREHQRARVTAGHPGAAFVTDYQALLAPADLEVIVVLTPMPQHAAMAKAALEQGKHVLVEKPMATSLADAKQLLALARQTQRHLVCAPFTTLSPTFQTIAARIRRGDIGTVLSARGRYGWAGPDWTDWFYQRGGGALFDLGVYLLTTLTGWMGPVRRVTALSGVATKQRSIAGQTVPVEADDNTQVLLDFGECRFASVTTGFTIQQYRGPGLELFGTEGTINLLGDDWDPDGYELWQNSAGCWQCFKETHPDWPWTDGLRHLIESVHAGRPLRLTPDHAYHVLEVMLQAKAAGADGCVREIESTFVPPSVPEATSSLSPHRVHDRTRQEADL